MKRLKPIACGVLLGGLTLALFPHAGYVVLIGAGVVMLVDTWSD
jgi:hypothetical protein